MAGIAAQEQGCDSVVLYNESNRICEAHNANIFIFRDDEIITPSLGEYCLDGVMRQHVIAKCKALNKPLFQEEITEEALLMADEVFVTNASKGIQWVESYGGKFYGFERVQELFSELF